jgi:hypothetical protein
LHTLNCNGLPNIWALLFKDSIDDQAYITFRDRSIQAHKSLSRFV